MDRALGGRGGRVAWLDCPRCGARMVGTTVMPPTERTSMLPEINEPRRMRSGDRSDATSPELFRARDEALAQYRAEKLQYRKGVTWAVKWRPALFKAELVITCPKPGCARSWSADPLDIHLTLISTMMRPDRRAPFPVERLGQGIDLPPE